MSGFKRFPRRWFWAIGIAIALTFGLAFTPQRERLVAQEPKQDFPSEFTEWEPYSQNPVFTGAGPGHWDEKIRERGWIIKEDETWHLWYTGYDGTPTGQRMLGYATSNDGLSWTRFAQHPLVDDFWVEDMQVHKVGDDYVMFAEGLNDQAQILVSPDKIHWKSKGKLDIRLTNNKPISPGPYGTPTAIQHGDAWYVFYERSDQGVWMAKSKDMQVWQHIQDNPVIPLGPEKYDSKMIALNQIIKYKDRFYAVYHGTGSAEKPRLWTTNLAVSDDLLHWTKYRGNPLRPESENKSSGQLVHDGLQFRLYTMHDKVEAHFPKKR